MDKQLRAGCSDKREARIRYRTRGWLCPRMDVSAVPFSLRLSARLSAPCRRALFTLAASVAVVFMPSTPVTKARTEGNNTPKARCSTLLYCVTSEILSLDYIVGSLYGTGRGLAQTLITYVTVACTTERSRSPSSTSICSTLSRSRHKIRE